MAEAREIAERALGQIARLTYGSERSSDLGEVHRIAVDALRELRAAGGR